MNVTARARRSGDWWAIEVPEVDGVFTQAKRLDQVPEMVADAVALLEDVDPATVEVEVVPVVSDAVQAALAQAVEHREQAELLNAEASTLVRQVALDLTAAGYSLRDIGVVIGVSHQRVAQLLEPRPVTIKEAGEAAIAGMDRTSTTRVPKSNAKSRTLRSTKSTRSVSKKSRAAAALAQSPKRKGSVHEAAARATGQPNV